MGLEPMQILENEYDLSDEVSYQSWFVVDQEGKALHREVYLYNGFVVAIHYPRSQLLYVEHRFYTEYKSEECWEAIQNHAGVYNKCRIKLFDIEGD